MIIESGEQHEGQDWEAMRDDIELQRFEKDLQDSDGQIENPCGAGNRKPKEQTSNSEETIPTSEEKNRQSTG
jgi:hypothetical protein